MNKRMLGVVVIGMMGLALALAGCKKESGGSAATQTGPKGYPYKIVTTVAMVSDIVRQVAGEKGTVQGLIGEGVDPHLYKPTRNDIAAMMEAEVIVYSGLMLEGKMADTLVKMATGGKPVYAVTELIDEKSLLEADGHNDPHVWMDVAAWSKGVEAVAQSLGKFDPANAEYYKSNAENYRKELEKLDAYAKQIAATVPAQGRVLITAHDAFNYFGRAYGFEVMGIQGLSTESEAGLRDIQRLVDLIVSRDIKAVFVETSVSEKNVRALVEGAKARGKEVKVGGLLFSDAMGPAGSYEGTYIGMIDHHVTTIVRALGGEAPEKGMAAKLAVK